ncbi:MAG: hypothetical protein IPO83_06110 [Chitinophagaceae bacterium]|nr:hypothetical protein [Chitinophagaceae bacterium]
MDKLTLFRGISVPEETEDMYMDRIKTNGIGGNEGKWKITVFDLKNHLQGLFYKDNLSTDDTHSGNKINGICAADKLGAIYYAVKHNRSASSPIPLLISFDVPLENVWIDGRDFLYTIFQMWDKKSNDNFINSRNILAETFGNSILQYFDHCHNSKSQERVAFCDLAINDPNVIREHYQNSTVIFGRHGTMFRSAFIVKPPISHFQIISVEKVDIFIPPFQKSYRLIDIIS